MKRTLIVLSVLIGMAFTLVANAEVDFRKSDHVLSAVGGYAVHYTIMNELHNRMKVNKFKSFLVATILTGTLSYAVDKLWDGNSRIDTGRQTAAAVGIGVCFGLTITLDGFGTWFGGDKKQEGTWVSEKARSRSEE